MKHNEAYRQALEAEHSGDWDRAHQIVQDISTAEAAWIHAYLHRVEGDLSNAAYWYRRADKPECTASLSEEYKELVRVLSTSS